MCPGSFILDFGCGYGFFSALMATEGYKVQVLDVHYNAQTGMDRRNHRDESCPPASSSDGVLQILNVVRGIQNFDVTLYDGIEIPFPNDFFEGAVAIGVLEHISPDDLPKCILEINRVLVPGGRFFVFYTPRRRSYAESLSRLLGLRHHVVLFDDQELKRMLVNSGFEILFMDVHDMVIRDGPGIQWILNLLEPATRKLDSFLLKTPLRAYAHHIMCCAEKKADIQLS